MSASDIDESRDFRISASWSAPATLLLCWGGLAALLGRLLRLPRASSAAAAGTIVAGHVLSEVWHQLGHAGAAALTGYPMRGLRFWGLFSSSVYPQDEPPLPAATHIQRALGGPLASAALSLILAALLRATRPSLTRRVLWVLCLENLLVFTLQVFIPLGFNDGATLREWMAKR